jgi:hypothetical protein
MNRSKFIKKVRTQEHVGGKSVLIFRDFSMQADIVRAELRRKRKNNVRNNAKSSNVVSSDSSDPNVTEPVLPPKSISLGETYKPEQFLFRYGSPKKCLDRLGRKKFTGAAITDEDRAALERIRAGLRKPDGVGRGEEPALCGDGGDSSLSDQPV